MKPLAFFALTAVATALLLYAAPTEAAPRDMPVAHGQTAQTGDSGCARQEADAN
jgi:hypothetical protein